MIIPWIVYILFLFPLVYIAIIDWREHIIPNKIIVPLIVLSLLIAILTGNGLSSLLGGLTGFGITIFPMLLKGSDKLGMGDVKFAIFLGTSLGWKGVIITILLASLFAVIYFLYGRHKYNFDRTTRIPLAPFLVGGYSLTLVLGFIILTR